jgi:hypothetical protein
MKGIFSALFAAAHPPALAEPPAIVAQHVEAERVVAHPARTAVATKTDPLDCAARAYAQAIKSGLPTRAAMARALEAVARADLSSLQLTLNGPHTKAGDRVSRKGAKKAQRVLLAIADRVDAAVIF